VLVGLGAACLPGGLSRQQPLLVSGFLVIDQERLLYRIGLFGQRVVETLQPNPKRFAERTAALKMHFDRRRYIDHRSAPGDLAGGLSRLGR